MPTARLPFAAGADKGNGKRKWSGRQDSNLRPLHPQRSALPNCATARLKGINEAAPTASSSFGGPDPCFGGKSPAEPEAELIFVVFTKKAHV